MSDEQTQLTGALSIGALSRATSVPVETLRTWERRYGFPDPERNSSGHRVYDVSIIERLRLIDRALKSGNRASNVVGLDEVDLRELLAIDAEQAGSLEVRDPGHTHIVDWLAATRAFDGVHLDQLLRDAWIELGTVAFLEERVSPFLFELGAAWAERRIAVAHEHFASERLRDFLVGRWRPLSDRAAGQIVLCATLPGESHVLGLHMVALVCASSGMRVINIGADAPVHEVSTAAAASDAVAVALSVSVASNRFVVRRELAELRRTLRDDIQLLIGGLGAPPGLQDVQQPAGFSELAAWARGAA